jgi:hypothetical protein
MFSGEAFSREFMELWWNASSSPHLIAAFVFLRLLQTIPRARFALESRNGRRHIMQSSLEVIDLLVEHFTAFGRPDRSRISAGATFSLPHGQPRQKTFLLTQTYRFGLWRNIVASDSVLLSYGKSFYCCIVMGKLVIALVILICWSK